MGGEDILVEGGGAIHGNESIRNGNYTEKGGRTHMERGHTWRRDTHGEGTYTERGHTRRGNTYGERTHMERDTLRGDIHGEGTQTERGHTWRGTHKKRGHLQRGNIHGERVYYGVGTHLQVALGLTAATNFRESILTTAPGQLFLALGLTYTTRPQAPIQPHTVPS